jgi:H+-transporting ATPase
MSADGNATPLPEPSPGLTSEEARRRRIQFGPNLVPEEKPRLIGELLRKFWAPVPWMLEATVLLELVLNKRFEASIIAALLVFNAGLSMFQERRAQGALALLRQKLNVQSRAMRDGLWQVVPADDLVPGDYVHLRMGDIVPADVRIAEGAILVDQSTLTGESVPVEVEIGRTAYAGALIKRNEASGEVVATGTRTYFGKTSELIRSAKTVSHLERVIFAIVKYLVAMDTILVSVLLVYSALTHMPLADALPFALILLVASVPVALPATFTLATALGALELVERGVLVTRLSAIEEAAAMNILCSDKTGTITENRLSLSALRPCALFSEHDLLRFAAIASDEATQDPIDLAILSRARDENVTVPARIELIPFDPATKLAEGIAKESGRVLHSIKGAPQAVLGRVADAPNITQEIEELAAGGYRVMAVAVSSNGTFALAGLLGIKDPLRVDSRSIVRNLLDRGIRVVMITGDALGTARAVATEVGIEGRACSADELKRTDSSDCSVYANVFPEDKFHLVERLQSANNVVGMTGDGVNDAPALKQAEVGIAVANATDVAKASASVVLTEPGLGGVLAAVETSRRIYQRMLTYTLNKIIKTVEIALFLSLGVILTQTFIITPALIVLLLFTNDFVTMSIATDRVSFSRSPDRWHVGSLMLPGFALGSLILVFSLCVFAYGRNVLELPLPALQTLVFVTLVFTGQGTVYLIRERRHLWSSLPSRWMLASSAADLCIVSFLATKGILMAPISPALILGLLVACFLYLITLDLVKVRMLRWRLRFD